MRNSFSLSRYFELLGAPLKNSRWSWGAVRQSDGAIFLRQWEDHIFEHEGARYVGIWYELAPPPEPTDLGARERWEHVKQVKKNGRCFIVIVVAKSPIVTNREIAWFDERQVYPADAPQRIGDHLAVRLGKPIPFETMRAAASRS